MSELSLMFSVVDARDRLLEAALSAFAELGYHGATVREIAQRAGLSQGLIAHHFRDKEHLWDIVGERVNEDFLAFLAPVASSSGVDEGSIPRLLEAYMGYWRTHPSALRLQLWRVLGAPESERIARARKLNRRFVPIFARAQAAGFVRDDIAPGQAMTTAGSLIQYRLHSRLEMDNAIATTGASSPSDAAFLSYVWSLIAAKTGSGSRRKRVGSSSSRTARAAK